MNMIRVEEILKKAGLKLTTQRRAIIEVFMDYNDHVLTAEQIYEKTKEKHPTMNFSTVYRNLEILERINIIHKITMQNQASKYQLLHYGKHHHHFICKDCGKSEIIDFCPLRILNTELVNKNFVLTDHCFELYGYCNDCMANKSEA